MTGGATDDAACFRLRFHTYLKPNRSEIAEDIRRGYLTIAITNVLCDCSLMIFQTAIGMQLLAESKSSNDYCVL